MNRKYMMNIVSACHCTTLKLQHNGEPLRSM